MKKFIAPAGWFALEYPDNWNEFEDEEGTFLFYNPNHWEGNFRISAFKDTSCNYACSVMEEELARSPGAVLRKVGSWECVCVDEVFEEEGTNYRNRLYLFGKDQLSVECSFASAEQQSMEVAERIVSSVEIRDEKHRYPREIIPVRVWEIMQINDAFDWVAQKVKKKLKKDFSGTMADLSRMQILFEDAPMLKKREIQTYLGLTFGVILTNEMDGMEWVTVVDGKREFPALQYSGTTVFVDPVMWVMDQIQKGNVCDLQSEFDRIRNEIEKQL